MCGYTWDLCLTRSGQGRSHPHLCPQLDGHGGRHTCTACTATT